MDSRLRRWAGMAASVAVVAAVAAAPASRSAQAVGSARAAGNCSTPAAVQVVRELRLEADPGAANPVAQVLCGAFLGPGVEAMVASIRIPSCGGTGNWVVFRYEGGAWRLVFQSHNGAVLAAVGTDIKETQQVLRPSDAHCFPTGGTRSRLWHWTGSRFTHTPWKYSKQQTTGRPTKLHYFESPSHNIWCSSGDEGQAYCATRTPARSARLELNGTLTVCARRRCGGPARWVGGDPVLGYRRVNEQGGFRCRSELAGITCTVMLRGRGFAFGKGFRISRSGITRVGS